MKNTFAQKDAYKKLVEFDTFSQFHQHFTSSFWADVLSPKNQEKARVKC